MTTVRYGDVVQADEVISLEEKMKRLRIASEELPTQSSGEAEDQTNTPNNNQTKKRSV